MVPVPRERVWAALVDPDLVARLTPFVSRIDRTGTSTPAGFDPLVADGRQHWAWSLSGISVAGVDFAATFTEEMTFTAPSRLEFRHDPPRGAKERAGVTGWYALSQHPDGALLETSLTIRVDLPLPRMSGPVVRRTMGAVVEKMGDRFSARLLAHLGVSGTPE